MRSGLVLGILVATALALSACGSSKSDDAAHRRALRSADAALTQANADIADPPLLVCTKAKAAKLSTARLQQVAVSSKQAQKQFAAGLLVSCVRQNVGVGQLRQQITKSIDGAATSASDTQLPDGYLACLKQKSATLSADQIAGIVAAYPAGQAGVEAKGEALGKQLGLTCLGDPTVSAGLRALFVKSIKSSIPAGSVSSGFRNCILGKANALPSSQIVALNAGLVTGKASEGNKLEALGKQWAKQCAATVAP